MKLTLAVASSLAALAASAAAMPYDDAANAPADVAQALVTAGATHKPVLLVFGADWCKDSRELHVALTSQKNAEMISKEFLVFKVDVGNFNRNLALNAQYGNPIGEGIPAAVVLAPSNHVLYATRAGELTDARRMTETGVFEFFRKAAASGNERR